MIPAARRAWFARWFARQSRRRIEAAFGRVELSGLEHLIDASKQGAVVVIANHTSWWDPLLLQEVVVAQAGLSAHVMMDAANLRRFRFFALAGAFGVDLDSPRDGVAGIRYGAQRLDGPGAALVIFPQGAERPAHEPLVFLPGAARIAHMADAAVVPLGLRYVFADTPRPRVLASLGPPMSAEPDRKHAVALQQDAVRAQLQRIEDYLSGADHRFEAIHESSAGWVDRLMTGALDRLAAFVVPISAEQQSALAQSQGAFPPAHTGRAEGTDERDE